MSTRDPLLSHTPPADSPVVLPLRMTEREFAAWRDERTRAEWVEGEVVVMSPANKEHVQLNLWLLALLQQYVEQKELGNVFFDFFVRFAQQRRLRVPDVAFVSANRQTIVGEEQIEGAPDLIVEIVSPDSLARDWREKYLEYQAAGVQEYWIVDPMAKRAEMYALDAAGSEQQYRRLPEADGAVRSVVLPGLLIRTEWLWPPTRPAVAEALRQILAS